MIKKITALVIVLCLSLSTFVCAAEFSDVTDKNEYSEAISVLTKLGILSGMGDGTFMPEGTLTRAQFAKIAVTVMGKTDEAATKTSAFSDVKSSDWYSGYVNVVANEGIITGYPDGSFGANDSVTYAQAITVLIRLLGYDGADVGYKWPMGYIDKAEALSITNGLDFNANDIIDRKTTALIIYRALFTNMKGTKQKLIAGMDKTVFEDCIIVATSSDSTAILSHQVKTNEGVFTFDENNLNMEEYAGCKGTLVVDDNMEVICFVPDNEISEKEYIVAAAYNEGGTKNVTVLDESGSSVTIGENTTVYYRGGVYTASVLTSGINPGSSVKVFNKNGAIQHVFVDEYNYQGPKVVLSTSNVERMFAYDNINTLKVVRKGFAAEMDDIELYDVLYYSDRTNTLYAYADRVTGMYEKAYPMKSNVTKVTVSGKEYNLATLDAINKLNESDGAFKIGDRVTLLLGETGDVVDVVNLTEKDVSMYGVITGSGKEISDDEDALGRTEYYVTIMHASGNEVKYNTSDDRYSEKIGKFCSIDFENSYAVLTFPSAVTRVGTIDKDSKTLGDVKFAAEFGILEYTGTDEKPVITPVTIEELDGVKIAKSDVKHAEINKKGEIVVLYIDSVTGNSAIYGIIIEAPDKETGIGNYVLLSQKTEYTVSGKYTSYAKGDCVSYNAGEMKHMTRVATGTVIEGYIDNLVTMSGKTYTLADDVAVYVSSYKDEAKTVSVLDALNYSGKVVFYSDKSVSEGGKVRVISIVDNN
ncbi:MAG: S-layer homology domain-containing protein [Clostridia bacterium]|nr:S-layer homology domain-containing protein [Clostridia bacterium]